MKKIVEIRGKINKLEKNRHNERSNKIKTKNEKWRGVLGEKLQKMG